MKPGRSGEGDCNIFVLDTPRGLRPNTCQQEAAFSDGENMSSKLVERLAQARAREERAAQDAAEAERAVAAQIGSNIIAGCGAELGLKMSADIRRVFSKLDIADQEKRLEQILTAPTRKPVKERTETKEAAVSGAVSS